MNKSKLEEIREKLKTTYDPVMRESLELFLTMYSMLFGDAENMQIQKKWLDVSETCRYLKISTRTLQNYRNRGMLPYSQINAKIYFRLTDLNKFIENHMVNKYGKGACHESDL
jgi:hypothetical protein